MTIEFNAVQIRSPRRVRFVFTNTLGAGAFTSVATYSVASVSGDGMVPAVVAALIVPSSPNVVELALDADLTDGAIYQFDATGTPGAGSSVVPAGGPRARIGVAPQAPRVDDSAADDLLTEIYGEDLVWDGTDMVEDASGDLATVGGLANVEAAQVRRLTSDGLKWRPGYGTHPRQFVDGPYQSVARLRGACVQQALQDDRVKRASASLVPPSSAEPNACAIEVDEQLVGGLETTVQAPVKVG